MIAYVKGVGNISPQMTWRDDAFSIRDGDQTGNYLSAIEPDYAAWINPQQLRRISRILKMGTAAASIALQEAKLSSPDAIITGTGMGCVEDTGKFLDKITTLNEEALNPTPFMQSTHNTIGSQIGLMVGCKGYNQTYVQGAFSFEHSLMDALMQLDEQPDFNILVGGVDEVTETYSQILQRFGLLKRETPRSMDIFSSQTRGTILGEGAAYFVLSRTAEGSNASIQGIKTLYQPHAHELHDGIDSFLAEALLNRNDVDLVLTGKSGDAIADKQIDRDVNLRFPQSSLAVFKHLCGEHMVASSFALWLAVYMLKHQQMHEAVVIKDAGRPLKNILVYNRYYQDHHSLLLVRSC
ncbi:MAG TPA: beta-ketoacyl synthase N-terminal-like domain-containing protein [Ohtaekwangia sp.]|nr:beta-ketoacyl synthase N-terminal-like domain-containing protein [Ohtaekwangia sp.]